MELRTLPIRKSGNRVAQFMGGDRELVMFAGLAAFALVFSAQDWSATIYGVALWVFSLWALRKAAKSDPQLRHVYLRHIKYKKYYSARSTPFRENTQKQGARYK